MAVRMTHIIFHTHCYPIFWRGKLRLGLEQSLAWGDSGWAGFSILVGWLWSLGSLLHITKWFLFPEPQKVCSPKADLTQECVSSIKYSLKYFPTKSMELRKKKKKKNKTQPLSSGVWVCGCAQETSTPRDELDFHRHDTGSEKGRLVGSGQIGKASWKGMV